LQFALERPRQIGTWFQKILKIGCGENQHLPCPVATEEVVALAGPRHLDPAGEVFFLLLWLLREKIIGDAERHLAALMQFLDDAVILWVILKSTTRVDDAR